MHTHITNLNMLLPSLYGATATTFLPVFEWWFLLLFILLQLLTRIPWSLQQQRFQPSHNPDRIPSSLQQQRIRSSNRYGFLLACMWPIALRWSFPELLHNVYIRFPFSLKAICTLRWAPSAKNTGCLLSPMHASVFYCLTVLPTKTGNVALIE